MHLLLVRYWHQRPAAHMPAVLHAVLFAVLLAVSQKRSLRRLCKGVERDEGVH